MLTSQAECNILCYSGVWFSVAYKAPAAGKNVPLPSGMQYFMSFRCVVSGATRSARSWKNAPLLSGMQYFMLFWCVVSGAIEGAGNLQKCTAPKQNTIFYLILVCSFWCHNVSGARKMDPFVAEYNILLWCVASGGYAAIPLVSEVGIEIFEPV